MSRSPRLLAASALGAAIAAAGATAEAQAPPSYPPPYPYPPPYAYGPAYPYPPVTPVASVVPGPPTVVPNWDPDVPPPRGYRMTSSPNGALLGSGIAFFTAGWATAAVAGAIGSAEGRSGRRDDWQVLYVPLAGPFLGLGSLEPNAAGVGVLIADGIFQIAGVAGIVGGFLDRRHKVVRESTGLRVAPLVVGDARGLTAAGRF